MEPIVLAAVFAASGAINVIQSIGEHKNRQRIYKEYRELMRRQRQRLADRVINYRIRAEKEMRLSVKNVDIQAKSLAIEGAKAIGEAEATLGSDAAIAGTADAVVDIYRKQVEQEVYGKLGLLQENLSLQQTQIEGQTSELISDIGVYEQQMNVEQAQWDTRYSFNEGLLDFVQGGVAGLNLANSFSSFFRKGKETEYIASNPETGEQIPPISENEPLSALDITSNRMTLDNTVDMAAKDLFKQYKPRKEYIPFMR